MTILRTLNHSLADYQISHIDGLKAPRDLLSSQLQKSLRRGAKSFALAAAKSLLADDSKYFWRRLTGIVFEDFGPVDLFITAAVTEAARNNSWREEQGQFKVAAYLIDCLCLNPKDRRVDNLYMLGVALLRYPTHWSAIRDAPSSVRTLVEQAAQLIGGAERKVPFRSYRAIVAGPADEALASLPGLPQWFTALCINGRKASNCLLPLILAQIFSGDAPSSTTLQLQTVDNASHKGVLLAAADGYTELGRRAISRLLSEYPALKSHFRTASPVSPAKAAAMLLFVVEGGLLNLSLQDELGEGLRALAVGCWSGLPTSQIPPALEALKTHLPALNAVRRQLLTCL